jgi:SAM-dependent methyltransferase
MVGKKSIAEKNKEWFKENEFYSDFVKNNQTYKNIRHELDLEVKGIEKLLDIGNGGVFNYNTSLVKEIYAVDLFFDEHSSKENGTYVKFMKGNALDIPFNNPVFDGVIIVSLLHHLVGKRFSDIESNIDKCFDECYRVLKPGGKIILHEPCIPTWFLLLEKAAHPLLKTIVEKFMKHPFAIQLTPHRITELLQKRFKITRSSSIKKKGQLLHFGIKVPAKLSMVIPCIFVAVKEKARKAE